MASTFNPDDSKYKCCCGNCGPKQGVLAISIYELIVYGLYFILTLVMVFTTFNLYVMASFLLAVTMVVASVLGIVGVKKNATVPLLIDYIIHIVGLVITIIAIIIIIIYLVIVSPLAADDPVFDGKRKGAVVAGDAGVIDHLH